MAADVEFYLQLLTFAAEQYCCPLLVCSFSSLAQVERSHNTIDTKPHGRLGKDLSLVVVSNFNHQIFKIEIKTETVSYFFGLLFKNYSAI